MGFLDKVKKKVKGFTNRFQLDDKLAEEIYNIICSWDGCSGIKFKERDRVKSKDKTMVNAQGEEYEGQQVEIKNEKLFCISRLKKYPDDYSVIPSKGINEIEIDNLKGFELFAKNNDKENEEMYQVILFDGNGGYYLFIGTYITGSEKAISDIKSVIQTFKRKK